MNGILIVMMKNKNILRIYGILFLTIGFVWMIAIPLRGEGPFFKKKVRAGSFRKIQQEMTERVKGHPVAKHIPDQYIYHFWALAGWEFVCALLYAVAGVALLRGYPWKRGLCAAVLTSDILLKLLIVSYHATVLQPLKKICQTVDILKMYLTPDGGAASVISSYLTGIRLVRPGALLYGVVYIAFLILSYGGLVRRPPSNN